MLRFWLLLSSFLILGQSPLPGSTLCVSEEWANLRQGPDTKKFPITFEAIRYMPLEKLSKQNGWYRVKDVDGEIHWIREDLVSPNMKCAVVKGEFAHLRQGPGTNFPYAPGERADRYLSFRVVETHHDWVRIEDPDGDQAWIHKPLLWVPQ